MRRILAENALALFQFTVATNQQDLKQATDMLITTSGEIAIAVRLRRPHYDYRDLTIRAYRSSDADTELKKLTSGHGDFYLYGWTQGFRIAEWMLVDLHKLRQSGLLLLRWPRIYNRDQTTGFIAIPAITLDERDCLVAHNLQLRERI